MTQSRDDRTHRSPEGSSSRRPTSHEQSSGRPWDASYQDVPAPWDIGRPQPAIVRIAHQFVAPVLDAGCGTGENALHLASLGLPVVGVDVAETALALAREKAAARGLHGDFLPADACQLDRLGRKFQTVLDCGLFHTFHAEERTRYVASLASVTEPGATLYILCFSDAAPDTGPHPIREEELRAAFSTNQWRVAGLERTRIETCFHEHGAPAWLATIHRT